ncbi:hypothetical protein OYE22_18635 [Streptomyces sp. 71268]|uniref:hypothetical protein n=1 Tax=Streptomyces sp. 71268 TaxID=3002640 RepID=UPI0023F87EBF|nr:hypothetical protein [Streptomyces sp. 71268]WEV26988.1 hypothetical protein OYE22_18635 [Streptomyces sp. 71268]
MLDSGSDIHETTTTETGAFCLARCSCGWSGPARRARSRARTDADEHRATQAAQPVPSVPAPRHTGH